MGFLFKRTPDQFVSELYCPKYWYYRQTLLGEQHAKPSMQLIKLKTLFSHNHKKCITFDCVHSYSTWKGTRQNSGIRVTARQRLAQTDFSLCLCDINECTHVFSLFGAHVSYLTYTVCFLWGVCFFLLVCLSQCLLHFALFVAQSVGWLVGFVLIHKALWVTPLHAHSNTRHQYISTGCRWSHKPENHLHETFKTVFTRCSKPCSRDVQNRKEYSTGLKTMFTRCSKPCSRDVQNHVHEMFKTVRNTAQVHNPRGNLQHIHPTENIYNISTPQRIHTTYPPYREYIQHIHPTENTYNRSTPQRIHTTDPPHSEYIQHIHPTENTYNTPRLTISSSLRAASISSCGVPLGLRRRSTIWDVCFLIRCSNWRILVALLTGKGQGDTVGLSLHTRLRFWDSGGNGRMMHGAVPALLCFSSTVYLLSETWWDICVCKMIPVCFLSEVPCYLRRYVLGVQQIDRYLMFYTQSTAKGYIRAKQNVFLPQVKIVRNLGKMKLNELGRQKLCRKKPRQQAQHAKLYSDLLQA